MLGSEGHQIQEKEVGIITPFCLQCDTILQRLKEEGIIDIEVGTPEYYQGREKEIIILSTVRSRTFGDNEHNKHLGFLSDPKRTNVALTRAKSLLILVGNLYARQIERSFTTLAKKCMMNGTLFNKPPEIQLGNGKFAVRKGHILLASNLLKSRYTGKSK